MSKYVNLIHDGLLNVVTEKFFMVFQLTVGVIGQKETVFDKPMTPGEIQSVMYSTIQPYDVIGAVLQQVISTSCAVFNRIICKC